MTHWKAVMRVQHLWSQAKDETITIHQLAQAVAKRLRAKYPEPDTTDDSGWLDDVISMFEELPENCTADDFDIAYDELCSWGDQEHRLFIKTF